MPSKRTLARPAWIRQVPWRRLLLLLDAALLVRLTHDLVTPHVGWLDLSTREQIIGILFGLSGSAAVLLAVYGIAVKRGRRLLLFLLGNAARVDRLLTAPTQALQGLFDHRAAVPVLTVFGVAVLVGIWSTPKPVVIEELSGPAELGDCCAYRCQDDKVDLGRDRLFQNPTRKCCLCGDSQPQANPFEKSYYRVRVYRGWYHPKDSGLTITLEPVTDEKNLQFEFATAMVTRGMIEPTSFVEWQQVTLKDGSTWPRNFEILFSGQREPSRTGNSGPQKVIVRVAVRTGSYAKAKVYSARLDVPW